MTAASAAVSEDVVASYEMFSILNDGPEHTRAAPATPAVARGTVGRVGQPGCAVRLTAPSDVEHGEDDCSALTTAQQESTSDLPRGGPPVLDPRPVRQAATDQHGPPRTSSSEQHVGDEFVAEGATVFAIPRD